MSNKVTKNGNPIEGTIASNMERNKALMGKFARDERKTLNAKFYRAQIEDVPVEVPSLINRDTEIKNLIKVVRETGGFDCRVWTRPKVARIANTGEIYLFDGDHSRALFKEFYPQAKKMPVDIINVDEKSEVHKLFIRYNARCKTAIKAEEIFVHEFHAGDDDAISLANRLSGVGLHIYCSHEPGGSVGDSEGARVKYGAVRTAFRLQDQMTNREGCGYDHSVREAVEILNHMGAMNKSPMVPAELLGALTMILSLYPTLRSGQADAPVFREWLKAKAACDSIGDIIENFKRSGGYIENQKEYSCALGILKGLNQIPQPSVLEELQGTYKTNSLTKHYGTKGRRGRKPNKK